MTTLLRLRLVAALLLAGTVFTQSAGAQPPADPATQPAFSVASSHIATTRERPTIDLLFRRVASLDFRVYRVNDPLKFFAGLRDPHALGSEAPLVPQEQTLLERVARWKAARRQDILAFFRGQFSHRYRAARRESAAKTQIAQRQPVEYRQFAQVPLLNRSQLVSSWRERLPMVRDTEVRRIPLDLPGEGVYVVEAVNGIFKAYTVVIVSDLGLVTKAAPGQLIMFAANRFTGEPAPAGCPAEVIANRNVVANGSIGADGTWEATLPDTKPEDVIAVVHCGTQVAATDPGAWMFQDSARSLTGYVYTDKPVYRPGHTVNIKAVLRWRAGDSLTPFDRKQVEVSIADPNDKVVLRQQVAVDEFGSVLASHVLGRGVSLGRYSISIASGDDQASGGFEVQEYRKPEFEVIVKPAARFAVQGGKVAVTITGRYYFGQPVANAAVKYIVHKQPYYSPFRWADDEDGEGREPWWFGGEQAQEGTALLDGQGVAEILVPLEAAEAADNESVRDYSARIEARVTDASSREVSGSAIVHATVGRFMLVARPESYAFRAGGPAAISVRAVDYAGAVQPGVRVLAVLERLVYEQGHWEKPVVTPIAEGSLTTDADGRAAWSVTLPREPGNYRFRVSADADGRTVTDTAYAWVSGSLTGGGFPDQETTVELLADKKTYQPGEVAHLTLKGAVSSAALLVTKEARQVSWRQVLRPAAVVVDVPVGEGDLGDTYVNVAFLKDDRLYRAETRLRVPAVARQLQVTVVPDQAVGKPRQPAGFTINVADHAGRPVRAQVSLGVIDEAVYGVQPDGTPDPLRFFYRREYSRVGTQFSREYPFIGYSGTQQLLLAQRRRPTSLADFKADRPARPQVRKEFPDAIYWNGGPRHGRRRHGAHPAHLPGRPDDLAASRPAPSPPTRWWAPPSRGRRSPRT